MIVNSEAVIEKDEASTATDLNNSSEGEPIKEPCVGMEFESEEAAREFYNEYATSVGFIVRLDQCRRSEVDGRILSRRFSCNKQGFYAKARDSNSNSTRPNRKPRTSTREGCKAMMLVKLVKSGKWVVTRFFKDHTHQLGVSDHSSRSIQDKDRKIEDLKMKLKHQDQLCDLYRELLIRLLDNVEEQTKVLSRKVEDVVNNVRELENDVRNLPQNRKTQQLL